MENHCFADLFLTIELPSPVAFQHLEAIEQAAQIIELLRYRCPGNELPCQQSITGQQICINQIVLAQYADAFSELPDLARIHQVDCRTGVVKELDQLLMLNMGGFYNEGERLDR